MTTLAAIRAEHGAQGVAQAIARVLGEHRSVTAAARALGTTPRALRRAARRVGVPMPSDHPSTAP